MSASAGAAQWNVNDDTTLRCALINAAHGDLLNFAPSITVVGRDLPAIVKNLTINGNNYGLSGANQYRGLFAYSGSSLIANLNIGQTLARGGNGGSGRNAGGGGAGLGGGLFVAAGASVSIANVQFFSSSAVGGTGGSENLGIPGDGGGGGMGGNGGSGGRSGGGGLGSAAHGGGGPTQSNRGGAGIVTGAALGGLALRLVAPVVVAVAAAAALAEGSAAAARGASSTLHGSMQRRRFWCRPIGSLRGRWRRGNGRRRVCDAGRIADDRGKHDPIWRQRVGGSAPAAPRCRPAG